MACVELNLNNGISVSFDADISLSTNSIINSGFGALGNMINAGVNFATKDYTVRRVKRGVPFRLTSRNRYDDISNGGW